MLVLSRKIGESVVIGNSIRVTVLGFDRGFVKVGIDAPRSIPVHRQEVQDKIVEINRQSATAEFDAIRDAFQKSGLQLTIQSEDEAGDNGVASDLDDNTPTVNNSK